MKTFTISTLGCKVNQYESQQVRELLERLGLQRFTPPGKPDLAIINTCCITHIASAKSRKYIHKIQALYPDTTVVVCGCLPTVQNDELISPARNVHFIKDRSSLASFIIQTASISDDAWNCPDYPNTFIKPEKDSKIKHKKDLPDNPELLPLTAFKDQTRAFLKIQDGCDARCSYCIIPKTRPIVQSRATDEIIAEAKALVKAGHKEIVVTGISVGAYGQTTVKKRYRSNQTDHLAALLAQLAQIPDLARIRLSSLEPADITDRLVEVFHSHRNIMPHLHLSLQSGSDNVLKKMCRQYRTDEVLKKIDLFKSSLDRPAITADIIVGFPGETDADFQQTVDLARYIGFSKMHIFRFSPRQGTAASKIKDTVDNQIVKHRAEVLHNLDIELGTKFRQQFIGQTVEVLIENDTAPASVFRQKDAGASGRCERYFMVNLKNFDNKLYCKKDVISTGVSPLGTNGVEKSGLDAIHPDFSTSAATQPALDMTASINFLQCNNKPRKNDIVKAEILEVTPTTAIGQIII
jgi:threonylcarbamoyladenosine tRNA methylthiotransferase MtaB